MSRRAAHLPKLLFLLSWLAAAGCGKDGPRRDGASAPEAAPAPSPRRLFALQQGPTQGFSAGAISPDGTRFAYALTEGDAENIWVADVATGRAEKVTDHHDAVRIWPQWSRDSRLLTYLVHYDSGRNQIAVLDVASKAERIVWTADSTHWPDSPVFWPDGRIVFMLRGWPSAPHAGDMPAPQVWQITSDGAARPLEEIGPADFPSKNTPVASPDGKLAAWVGPVYKDDDVIKGLWVVELETAKQTCLAAPLEGGELYWAAGSRALFLMGETRRSGHWVAYAAPLGAGGVYRLGSPRGADAVSADTAGNVYEVRPDSAGRPTDLWVYPHAFVARRMADSTARDAPSCEPPR